MSVATIVSIVEGHGEEQAVPVLLRRIAVEAAPSLTLNAHWPIRVKVGSFMADDDYFAKYIRLAAARAAQAGGMVLILLDCDDSCPAELGPRILEKAQNVRGDVLYLVVLAYREFETWFVASSLSLRGCGGLQENIQPPSDPEAIRGAKEWLGRRMPNGYDPIINQASFTSAFSFEEASEIHSFRRLHRKVSDYLIARAG